MRCGGSSECSIVDRIKSQHPCKVAMRLPSVEGYKSPATRPDSSTQIKAQTAAHPSDEQLFGADLQPSQQHAAARLRHAHQQALVGGAEALDVGDGRGQALLVWFGLVW